ncbi:MAG: right-handed parallel beta-helix repeat-containing protein [Lachnospiraceae bacterium]|nr:right-handed parallel beta-helix repeat-containing protein [Lachnospiraceae bacterium]
MMGKKLILEEIQEILDRIPYPEHADFDEGEAKEDSDRFGEADQKRDCVRSDARAQKRFSVTSGEDVQAVWAELIDQMKKAKEPTDYVLQLEPGEHVITAPLCMDGREYNDDIRLTIEGKNAVLTGSVRLDSSRFAPVEGKPYYCYAFEPDARGEYPDFHFVTVNGRMLRPAGRGSRRATEAKQCIIKYRRTYDAATKAETNVKGVPKMYLDEELFAGVTERDFETMELYLELHWYFDIVHIVGIDWNDRIPEEHLVAVHIREEEYRAMRAPAGTDENYFPGHIYWVENCLTFLEHPGAYYYDHCRGRLYYYPENDEPIADVAFGYTMPENLLILKNLKNVQIRNLTLTGVDQKELERGGYYAGQAGNVFRGEGLKYAAVYGENLDGITICGCTFRDMAGDGLSVRGRLRRVRIASNRFFHIGATAIRCGDFCVSRWAEEVSMKELIVENNYLDGIGWFLRESVALMVSKVFNARIWYNTIQNCCYSAISVGTHYGPGSFQKDAVGGNLRNVVIAFNNITDFMTDMRDGAAIYTLGYNGDTGILEPFNYILGNVAVWSDISGDIHGEGHTSGWYNDNGSTHWLDMGNIQFLNPNRRWLRMYYHYVQTTAENVTIRRNAYVNRVSEENLYGDLAQVGEIGEALLEKEIIYWNIDAERNIHEADTTYFRTENELSEEWRRLVENAGYREKSF